MITGAVAIIAVVPQTVLPIAIKYDIPLDILNFWIRILITIKTLIIQTIIKGMAIDPNFINSKGFNWIPKQIIPSFRIYFWVKSNPIKKPVLILNKFPKINPKIIAIIAVEIGLFSYPNNSIPIILFKPSEKE